MKTLRLHVSPGPAPAGDLSARLTEAEETLRAIRSGEADVVIMAGRKGVQVLEQKSSERAYRQLIESMNEGALTMTTGAMILYCNSCFAKMVKTPLEKVIGVSLGRFLGSEDLAALRTALKQPGKAGSKLQVVLNANDYSVLPVQISIWPTTVFGDGRPTIGIVVTDVTEARRTEGLMRALNNRVVHAQEEERGRIAIELHDGVVQLLCGLTFNIQALLGQLPQSDNPARAQAESIREMAGKAADEVDRVSRNLRPTTLDQLGLVAALRQACREFTARSGVPIKVACARLSTRLPPDGELTLYRILQEALRNIEKHAKARHVRMRLSQEGMFAKLTIADDGVGFDPVRRGIRGAGKGGFGLLGMRERALFAGGDLELKSSHGSGTVIEINVPLTPAVPQAN